jgi:nucleoside-diphosphate-sugar epimerase
LRGDLHDSDSLIQGARQADAVIHAGFSLDKEASGIAAEAFARAAEAEQDNVRTFLETLAGTGKTLIVTSGVGVLGDTGAYDYAEDTPIQPPPQAAWRRGVEIDVLAAKNLNIRSMVIRVPMVYGRGGSSVPNLLLQAGRKAGVGLYPGAGENVWSTVAVDDLAALYVLALEKGPAGALFHATAGEPVSIRSIAEAVSRNIGAGGTARSWTQEEAQQFGLVAGGLSANLRASSDITRRVLGWRPTQPPILEDIACGSYLHAPLGEDATM